MVSWRGGESDELLHPASRVCSGMISGCCASRCSSLACRAQAPNTNAAPGEERRVWLYRKEGLFVLGRPGDDLLSRVLRHSTIGAEAFNGRVRDGIGF